MQALRRLVHALHASSMAVERKWKLSGAQLFVLQLLGNEESVSIKVLAGRTLTHQSSVSVVVARLAAKGLVKRGTGPADRRQAAVSITPAGRRVLRQAPATVQSRLLGALDKMPQADVRELAALLESLVVLAGMPRNPPLFLERSGPPKTK